MFLSNLRAIFPGRVDPRPNLERTKWLVFPAKIPMVVFIVMNLFYHKK